MRSPWFTPWAKFVLSASSRRAAMALMLTTGAAAAEPLFDAHLHYSRADTQAFSPGQILGILERNGIGRAVVSSTPNAGTRALYRAAPARIVPFASLYRHAEDKRAWAHDPTVIERLEAELQRGIYRGIGEFHLFAEDRDSDVFRRVVEIAAERGLVLQIHGDPAIIDAAFGVAPEVSIIWAHAGTRPSPPLIATYLKRYPRLFVDTSVRDERIAPEGRLDPAWRAAFMAWPERFLIGVDTFSPNRWRHLETVAGQIRGWLAQLPAEPRHMIGWENAARLFSVGEPRPSGQGEHDGGVAGGLAERYQRHGE